MVHQLELITDLLGTPSPEVIAKVGVCLLDGLGGEMTEEGGLSMQSLPMVWLRAPLPTTASLSCPATRHCLQVRNEKARRFLLNMRKKPGIPFEQYFPKADKAALRLLWRLLAFDPAERPTAGVCCAPHPCRGGGACACTKLRWFVCFYPISNPCCSLCAAPPPAAFAYARLLRCCRGGAGRPLLCGPQPAEPRAQRAARVQASL